MIFYSDTIWQKLNLFKSTLGEYADVVEEMPDDELKLREKNVYVEKMLR